HEKRGHRGYLFIIGDEACYPMVNPRQVKAIIGDNLTEPIRTEAIVAELKRRYEVYYILPAGASNVGNAMILDHWRDLLGQNVIELGALDAVCETIAVTVGLGEGVVDLAAGLSDLADIGSAAAAGTVSTALARVGAGRGAVLAGPRLPGLD